MSLTPPFALAALSDAIRIAHKFENMRLVGESVEQCGGQTFITKYLCPVGKAQVGGHHQRHALVGAAAKLEDQLRSQAAEWDEAEFIHHNQLVLERLGHEAV